MPENVEGVWTNEHNRGSLLRPNHVLGNHVNAPHQAVLGPVVEANEVPAADAQQPTSKDFLHGKLRLKGEALLEILEDGDLAIAIPGGIGAGVGPNKLEGRTVGLVSKRLSGVDDELPVAAHGEEPTVGMVRNVLREDLCRPHVLHAERHLLALAGGRALVQQLQVGRLDLVAFGPNDLARVHGGNWLLAAQFDHDSALIIAQRGCV
mmetsp:Transcript_15067/g.35566  ORF Transcript_15067/g.35566 Transcript_15067/m.35566 type:complete len:207 (+) Transcript_15067:1497-2117(+)